jgi:transcriptional repressor NF-X1
MCLDTCHAPFPCKEDRPCESKTFITCLCQNHKQEVRCLATRFNPWSTRETTLKCDDECLRLQRNRRLAEALNIDPETHLNDHIPYSDTTMKFCREDPTWAQTQEREFRVFASSPDEKRLRFKPMPANKRAFLHNLAEDFGLDSESEDPEPHRHVCIFKTPRFVSAPHKTLAQCMRILKNQAASAAAAAPRSPATLADRLPTVQPFNAFLLRDPRFGLTIEELEQALAADLASVSRSGPAIKFTTNFLPSDEIVVKATAVMTTAAIATSLAGTPQSIETALSGVKQSLAKTISRLGLAGAVELCHTDTSLNVTRNEGDAAASASGWNAVASRGSWRRPAVQPKALPASTPGRFVALKKLGKKAKESEKVEVEEDWLAAADKEEGEQSGKSGDEETRGKSGETGSEAEGDLITASA